MKPILLMMLMLYLSFSMCGYGQGKGSVRKCSGAGRWFPASKEELSSEVKRYLDSVEAPDAGKKIAAIISPHAGYQFSAKGAAAGYKNLVGKKYKRVIALGVNHTVYLSSASIMDVDAYETPLGIIPLDKQVCKELLGKEYFISEPRAHVREHSIENQLPFLQETLGEFKLVPILIGDLSPAGFDAVAESIKAFVDDETLIVVSSDFTHFGQSYGYVPFKTKIKENLKKLDMEAADLIVKKDTAGFEKFLDRTKATICGRNPIKVLLRILPKDAKGNVAMYYTSGDVTGDYSFSVSYLTIVFTQSKTM